MYYTWGDGSGLCYVNMMCCSAMSDYSDCCLTASIPTDPPVVIPIFPDISPPADDSQGPLYPDVTPGIDIRVPDTDNNKPPKPTNSNSNNGNQSPPKPPPKPPKSIGKIIGFGAFGFGATAMGGMYAKKKNDDRNRSEQEQQQSQ